MKTRLLKKVRRRYQISKIKIEPWMQHSSSFFDRDCWVHRNESNECYVTTDLYEKDTPRLRVSSTYDQAYDWLIFFIKKDYPSSTRRIVQREKIIWGGV